LSEPVCSCPQLLPLRVDGEVNVTHGASIPLAARIYGVTLKTEVIW
jgi:hypothetical protein